MNTITVNLKDLVEAISFSYDFNSREQHSIAMNMARMIVNNDEIFKEACKIAEKMHSEKNNEK